MQSAIQEKLASEEGNPSEILVLEKLACCRKLYYTLSKEEEQKSIFK